MKKDDYDKQLIQWVKNHYWDSLEKDKDLILRHLRTFAGDINISQPANEIEDRLAEILAVLTDIRIQGEPHEVTVSVPPPEPHCEHLGALYHTTAGWRCPDCGQIK